MSLLCVPLLCQASPPAAPCEPCTDEQVAQDPAPGNAPPPGDMPFSAAPLAAEKISAIPDTQAEPPAPPKVENTAVAAALADGITTKLALAAGGIETNASAAGFPLGLIGLTGAKILLVKYAETLPEENKRLVIKTSSAAWGGAAVNNLLIMLAVSPPVSLVAGIITGIMAWRHTTDQYATQDRLAALQKEKQDRLAATQPEPPQPTAPVLRETEQVAVAAND